ncbi:MAG TPA: hypothetical protein VL240_07210 [Candidatus Binatia bacterium]|nr:hypothetical protein [Candidatus Binatia bacterium]
MRWIASLFAAVLLLLPTLATARGVKTPPEPTTITCVALEIHASGDPKVVAVVFHQRTESQRSELATLLREHSGELVEVQASDGGWRRATMVRLKSCFGRGLLLLAPPAPFPEHTEFMLRLPAGSSAH